MAVDAGTVDPSVVLDDLLARYPDAPVAVLGVDMLPAAAPATLDVGRRRVVDSCVDAVVLADRMATVRAWGRATANGTAVTLVHLVDEPAVMRSMAAIDAFAAHGALVMLFLPEGTLPSDDPGPPSAATEPRVGRLVHTPKTVITAVDAVAAELLGWPADELVGRRAIDLVHPDDRAAWLQRTMIVFEAAGAPVRGRFRYQRRDGAFVWFEVVERFHSDPELREIRVELTETDDEMQAVEALAERVDALRALARALPVGILQADATGSVTFTNPRLRHLLGRHAFGTVDDLIDSVDEAGRPRLREAIDGVRTRAEERDIEVDLADGDGRRRVCTVTLRPVRGTAVVDGAGPAGLVACVTDVTASVQVRDELNVRATFDDLTGCHNRASSLRELTRLTSGRGAGVVYLDLDGFKPVNDRFGHATGDQVLAAVADRLRAQVRQDDIVGRLGGDEFVVLYAGVQDDAALDRLVARLQAALDEPVDATVGAVDVAASLGAVVARPGDAPDSVLAAADAAMYAAKRRRGRRS